jgi:pimeloyl-ACP methyl ester carboxylesterase
MYSLFEREKIQIGSTVCYQWVQVDPRACVVFIHGLGGNAYATWKNLPTLFMGTLFAQNKDIFMYSYESSVINPLGKNVPTLANECTTFLEGISSKYESFYFVSHSLGSLVCINAILNLLGRSSTWTNKIKGHVMLAPAIFGSNLARISPSPAARALTPNSEYLKELHNEWNLMSKMTTCQSFVLAGTKDSIVLKNSKKLMQLGISTKELSESHASIPKTNSIDNQTFRAILDCLYLASGSNPYDSRAYIRTLVLESSPHDWDFDDALRRHVFKRNHKLQIIQFDGKGEPRDFVEPWLKAFPDRTAKLIYYAIRYDNHHIEDFPMVLCDGTRYLIPPPKSATELTITSKQYSLAKILEREGFYKNLDQGLHMARIRVTK